MHDDTPHSSDPRPENDAALTPALEARIVAWVLGEASPFEVAELERLVAANPALAIFKRRIEAVHGLVGEAEQPVDPTLKLSAERRESLLKVIGVNAGGTAANAEPAQQTVVLNNAAPRAAWRKTQWLYALSATAAACFALFVVMSNQRTEFNYTLDVADPATIGRMRAEAENRARKDDAESVKTRADLEARQSQSGESTLRIAQQEPADFAGAAGATLAKRNSLPEIDRAAQEDKVGVTLTAMGPSGAAPTPASAPVSFGNQFAADAQLAIAPASPAFKDTDSVAALAVRESRAAGYATTTAAAREVDFRTNERLRMFGGGGGGGAITVTSGANISTMGGAGDTFLAGTNVNIANRETTAGVTVVLNSPTLVTVTSPDRGIITWNNLDAGTMTAGSGDTLNFVLPNSTSSTLNGITNLTSSGGKLQAPSEGRAFILDPNGVPVAATSSIDSAGFGVNALAGADLLGVVSEPTAAAAPPAEVVTLSAFEVSSPKNRAEKAKAASAPAAAARSASTTPRVAAAAFRSDAAKKEADADAPLPRAPRLVDEALPAEIPTSTQAVSTFSLHVSDVSYRLARAALARGERPDAASIRPEEFYNAFDYGDAAPVSGEPVAARIEQAAHPFLQQRNLVRVALKVPATGRSAAQPLRLTVLLDTSGSMEREDRVASVRRAFDVLASLLGPNDRITLIGFARTPRLLAERLPGDQAKTLNDIVRRTPAEGGTNLEEALKLAGEHARRDFTTGAQNRVVLLTDGAANLGNADPAQLAAAISALRQQGIAFDACGVGLNGLDDSVLEALTRKGDGRYSAINSPEEADTQFARQLAGAFRPAARDVKVQVRFNPARVRAQRLIGFEQHRLREEDFRNNAVDAAELAAEEAANALYQVEVLPEGEGELGEVFVRFRRADTGEIVERKWTLAYQAQPAAFDRASPSLRLAGSAALLAEKLRGGPVAGPIRLGELAPVVDSLRTAYPRDARVRDFITMFSSARRLVGE